MIASAHLADKLSLRDSKKRRRFSERRKLFSKPLAASQPLSSPGQSAAYSSSHKHHSSASESTTSDSCALLMAIAPEGAKISMKIQFHIAVAPDNEPLILDSHQLLGIAPGTPPASPPTPNATSESVSHSTNKRHSTTSESGFSAIGEHISERLSRQSSSTRRRQQLLALHAQSALGPDGTPGAELRHYSGSLQMQPELVHSNDDLVASRAARLQPSMPDTPLGRDSGARSSTITGGIQDEATARFLARHHSHQQQQQQPRQQSSTGSLLSQPQPQPQSQVFPSTAKIPSTTTTTTSTSTSTSRIQTSKALSLGQQHEQRERIFFKRDGQRFSQEFTLKLAVDKNYRCLIKVRPLIPLQAISIQGHQVSFVDCSLASSSAFVSSSTSSTITTITTSSSGLGDSFSISSSAPGLAQTGSSTLDSNSAHFNAASSARHQSIAGLGATSRPSCTLLRQTKQAPSSSSNPHRRLNHAQTTIGTATNLAWIPGNGLESANTRTPTISDGRAGSLSLTNNYRTRQLQQQLLRQQQHNQMMRHFSPVSSSLHANSQLVYMFDWSAGRFDVNKNKPRTEVQTVLKFQNGQILSLPLQVKFYEPESRQHLSWGNQLHFIDYDCNIDTLGQIQVDKIQYY